MPSGNPPSKVRTRAGLARLGWRDGLLAGLLFVAGWATRVPLWPALITNPDGAEYAWAVDEFNLAIERPHAPGSLLFVACGRLPRLVGADPHVSLLLMATCFSALACVALYVLAALMFGRWVALAAGVLLLFENNFWRLGLSPLPYTAGVFWAVAAATAIFLASGRSGHWVWVSAMLVGLATGFRLELTLVLVPLWLWGSRRSRWPQVLSGLALVGLLVVLWGLLTGWATGGYGVYRAATRALWREVTYPASVFAAATKGAPALVHSLLDHLAAWFDLVFGGRSHLSVLAWLFPGVYAFGRIFRLDLVVRDVRRQLLLFWVLPITLFFLLVYMGDRADASVYVAPFTLVAALGADILAADWVRAVRSVRSVATSQRLRLLLVLAFATGLNVAAFFAGTLPGLREAASNLQARLAFIRQFDPREVVLVQSDLFQDYPAVHYYTREYLSYLFQQTQPRPRPSLSIPSPVRLPEGVRYVILLNPAARVRNPARVIELEAGAKLKLVELAPGPHLMHFGAQGVRFEPASQVR